MEIIHFFYWAVQNRLNRMNDDSSNFSIKIGTVLLYILYIINIYKNKRYK